MESYLLALLITLGSIMDDLFGMIHSESRHELRGKKLLILLLKKYPTKKQKKNFSDEEKYCSEQCALHAHRQVYTL